MKDTGTIATTHLALEFGVNFLDTADKYDIGHNGVVAGICYAAPQMQALNR
jgi:aryl-alcohol dehydrogenase-like predicted oxidoreductase